MGMSRETVNAVRGLYSMASAIGLGINLTILVVTVFVFHVSLAWNVCERPMKLERVIIEITSLQ